MSAIISIKNLTVSYDRRPAVHHINGAFERGTLNAIIGPNGAGKSTLLKAIAGIVTPFEGSIEFHESARRDIAYLPQAADVQRDFPLSVIQMVSSGFWKVSHAMRRITQAQRVAAYRAIEAVGLQGFAHRTLDTLSSGQFQRALFARIIVQDAPIILLDEPFTAVDAATTSQLLEIIHQWHTEGRTVICVLHDLEQIRAHFSHCVLIARECVAWGKAEEVLTSTHLLSARFFREALPSTSALCEA